VHLPDDEIENEMMGMEKALAGPGGPNIAQAVAGLRGRSGQKKEQKGTRRQNRSGPKITAFSPVSA
jgi:hypothetical protein